MRAIAAVIYIFIATVLGVWLEFSYLGLGETYVSGAVIRLVYFLVVGLVFGYFFPERKVQTIVIGGVPFLLIILGFLSHVVIEDVLESGSLVFTITPLLAILGGYLAANVETKKN